MATVDLDGDGLNNDDERIWGLDPTNAASRNPLHNYTDLKSGSFTYTRRSQALTGMNFSVWTSTNLIDWDEDTSAQQTQESFDSNYNVETIETMLSPEILLNTKFFIKIEASE